MSTQKLTNEVFIQRLKHKFNDRYLLNKTSYINKRTKVVITCRIHGDFEVLPLTFLRNSCGCKKCAIKTMARTGKYVNGKGRHGDKSTFLQFCKNSRKYTDYYIQEARKVHGDEYKYLPLITPIISKEKHPITFICPKHGIQTTTLRNHLKGSKCIKCGNEKTAKALTMPFSDFVNHANVIHNNFYTYDKVSYVSASNKLTITCPVHGQFKQKATAHINGSKCPVCSKPEISTWKPEYWKEKQTIFYVLKLPNNLYKLGITCQKSVVTRYRNETTPFSVIFEHCFLNGYDARLLEIKLLKNLNQFRYKGPLVMTSVKNSEILTIDPSSVILSQVSRMFP